MLSNRKSKYSQRGSIANMSLRHSPNSDRATSARHDRANARHDRANDRRDRPSGRRDRPSGRRDDRHDRRVRDRRTSELETTRQPRLRK
jgi:hypothetical protein